jgi:hypothetical protein
MRKVAEKLSRFGLLKAETENRIYITEYIAPIMDWTNYNIDRKQEKRLSFQRSDYIKSWDIILEFLNNQTFDPTRVLDQNTQDILVLRSFFSKNVKTLVSTSWFTVKMLEDALLRIDDNKTKLLSSRIHVLLSEIVNIIGRNRNVRILVFAFIVLYSTVANVKKIVADGLLSRSEFFEAIDLAPSIVQPLFISKASFYSFFNAKAIKSDKYNSDVFAKIIFASDDEPLKDVVRKLEIYSNKGIVE